jgi:hypothetical protein
MVKYGFFDICEDPSIDSFHIYVLVLISTITDLIFNLLSREEKRKFYEKFNSIGSAFDEKLNRFEFRN